MSELKMKPLSITALLEALNSVKPYLGRGDDAGRLARAIDRHSDGIRAALQDASQWRDACDQMGILAAGIGEDAATIHACVSFIAYRAHKVNAQKATFKLEGLKLIDGVEAGDWSVTIERLSKVEKG